MTYPLPTLETLRWHKESAERVEAIWRAIHNQARAERRRWLYANDPLWRLSKLKDAKERRLRARKTTCA